MAPTFRPFALAVRRQDVPGDEPVSGIELAGAGFRLAACAKQCGVFSARPVDSYVREPSSATGPRSSCFLQGSQPMNHGPGFPAVRPADNIALPAGVGVTGRVALPVVVRRVADRHRD
jgi:hypothetical protein